MTRTALLTALLAALLGCSDAEETPPPVDTTPCTADLRECLDPFNARICRPDGSGFDYLTCDADAPCEAGLCKPASSVNNANNSSQNNNQNNTNNSNNTPSNNPNACTPFLSECVSDSLLRTCQPDGDGYDQGTCPPDRPCLDGVCGGPQGDPNTCIAGARFCIDSATLRVCRQSGTGYDNIPCDAAQRCDDRDPNNPTCRVLTRCTDADGDGYGVGEDCLGLDCDDTNYNLNPSAGEVCGNGVDEDCDGADAPCACDPIAQSCPGDRLKCSLNNASTFECRPNGVLGEGTACGGIPDSCERGTLCVGDGQGAQRCTRLCDPDSGAGCLGGAVCGATLNGQDGIGLCVGFTRCDPVDNPTACAQDETCQPTSNRDAGCFEGGGALTEGAACQPTADACGPGLTCIALQGAGATCRAWCKPSRGNTDCEGHTGDACAPVTRTFTFLGRTETITTFGVCD